VDDSLAFGKRFANMLSRNRFFSGQGKAADGKDLIYEGIATDILVELEYLKHRRKRPDLRRDCDHGVLR